jgi:hypothetical protein
MLSGNKWDQWTHLLDRLILVQLTGIDDAFKWNLSSLGLFYVKSMYLDLLNGHTISKEIHLRLKIPLKIKVFVWFLHKQVILTKLR